MFVCACVYGRIQAHWFLFNFSRQTMTDAQETPPWRRAVKDHIATLPEENKARLAALERLREIFHAELAAAAAPAFNATLKQMDRRNIESRRELSSWANTTCRTLGLAIKSNGRPAIMVTERGGMHDTEGRIRLDSRDATGARRTSSSASLPTVELMFDPPRVEPLSRSYRRRTENDPTR